MNLSTHKKLDIVLQYLLIEYNKGYINCFKIYEDLNLLNKYEIDIILEYLKDKGLILFKEIPLNIDAALSCPHFILSIEGKLFLKKTSFRKIKRNAILKVIWTILKIIAIILNAVAILYIGFKK